MCLDPIRIRNKYYNIHDLKSRREYLVPCGHCDQCQNARSNDYALRAVAEAQWANRHNGLCIFSTLTYKKEYLPEILLKTSSPDDMVDTFRRLSVWNHKHITNFFKSIRQQIARDYFDDDTTAFRFKYICSCERGSDRFYIDSHGRTRQATKRPHYHFALFVSPFAGDSFPLSYVDLFAYITSYWPYGDVKNEALYRDVFKASKYVTKYLTKGSSDDSSIYLHQYHCVAPDFDKSNYFPLRESRYFMPRLRISKAFGLTEDVRKSFFINGRLTDRALRMVVENPFDTKGSTPELPMPRYYIKSLCVKSWYFHGVRTPKFRNISCFKDFRPSVQNGRYLPKWRKRVIDSRYRTYKTKKYYDMKEYHDSIMLRDTYTDFRDYVLRFADFQDFYKSGFLSVHGEKDYEDISSYLQFQMYDILPHFMGIHYKNLCSLFLDKEAIAYKLFLLNYYEKVHVSFSSPSLEESFCVMYEFFVWYRSIKAYECVVSIYNTAKAYEANMPEVAARCPYLFKIEDYEK